jgi:hypothetical protein
VRTLRILSTIKTMKFLWADVSLVFSYFLEYFEVAVRDDGEWNNEAKEEY